MQTLLSHTSQYGAMSLHTCIHRFLHIMHTCMHTCMDTCINIYMYGEYPAMPCMRSRISYLILTKLPLLHIAYILLIHWSCMILHLRFSCEYITVWVDFWHAWCSPISPSFASHSIGSTSRRWWSSQQCIHSHNKITYVSVDAIIWTYFYIYWLTIYRRVSKKSWSFNPVKSYICIYRTWGNRSYALIKKIDMYGCF